MLPRGRETVNLAAVRMRVGISIPAPGATADAACYTGHETAMRPPQPWYERPGPVFAAVVAAAAVAFALLVLWRTFDYYRAFTSGERTGLPQFEARFTAGSLRASAARANVDVTSADAPAVGSVGAKITIVEFGDFECPYSREAYPAIRAVAAEHPELVRYEWRDFPLDQIHPHARLAAVASSCALRQGKFWEYHDKLFLNQNSLVRDALISYATQIGLDESAFTVCLDAGGDADRIARDLRAGSAAGVRGTPTFFVNGAKIAGAVPYGILSRIVENLSN